MIGPSIPKEILEERRKQSDTKKYTENDSNDESDDEIVGPQLPESSSNMAINPEQTADMKEKKTSDDNSNAEEDQKVEMKQKEVSPTPIREKQTLLSKHNAKNIDKHKITKFDSKENLNSEIRKEILRKLDQNGGLEGKFTRGS
ncbi:unnamed protein product [Debaryomyces tyrocola]|nr:unnamed protein product [Debaryomyces tyrocola]